jgi:redox-sensitive bicupin YhaK (pirin superfamily)
MLPWSTGAFEHQDFVGNAGRLGAGDLQWMSAGRGILHSEMPARGMTSDQIAHGLQLWVNLKSKDKMSEPSYQELPADKVTHVTKGDISARVIAGTALDTTSPVYTKTAVHYIHYTLQPGAVLQHRIPKDATGRGFNAFLYTIDGVIAVGSDAAAEAAKGKVIEAHHTVTLTNDGGLDGVTVAAGGDQPANFVLIAGEIIDEPIVQHGPFVMTSRTEIVQAITDFTEGKNGFEGAPQWRSEIGKPITDFLHGH